MKQNSRNRPNLFHLGEIRVSANQSANTILKGYWWIITASPMMASTFSRQCPPLNTTPVSHIQLFNPSVLGVRLLNTQERDWTKTCASVSNRKDRNNNEALIELNNDWEYKRLETSISILQNGEDGLSGDKAILFKPWLRLQDLHIQSKDIGVDICEHPWNEFHFQQTIKWQNDWKMN